MKKSNDKMFGRGEYDFKFDEYVTNVCKMTQRKLTVLTRIKSKLQF